MTTWFCSDWHFGHQRILELEPGRPGNGSITHHDEILIDRHNTMVRPDDDVWVLGDVAMGSIERSLECCRRMNGRKHLVCGNHDRPVMVSTPARKAEWIHRYFTEGGFTSICEGLAYIGTSVFPAGPVMVCHYPYRDGSQGEPDRYVDRVPIDRGDWLLHGHVHSRWAVNGHQINVGVDVWDYAPVHVDDLVEIMTGACGE